MIKKQWSMNELHEIYNRHSAELNAIRATLDTKGLMVDVDDETNEPFFKIILREGRPQDTSHVPATVGKPGDEVKLKIEYRPQAFLL